VITISNTGFQDACYGVPADTAVQVLLDNQATNSSSGLPIPVDCRCCLDSITCSCSGRYTDSAFYSERHGPTAECCCKP
jgi:hypothetical protein